jgi:hypothetical protein
MSPDKRPISDLSALEAALASLEPRADGLDRDRLMFLAGRASSASPPLARLRTWQAAFVAMSAIAASLLVAIMVQPGPQVVGRTVPVAPESNSARPVPADREPASLPDGPVPVHVTSGNNGSEPARAWHWAPIPAGRSDWRRHGLAYAGLPPADFAALAERGLEDGMRGTSEPSGVSTRESTLESPAVSYRDLLNRLLKERNL